MPGPPARLVHSYHCRVTGQIWRRGRFGTSSQKTGECREVMTRFRGDIAAQG
jgi:hypothetical protein